MKVKDIFDNYDKYILNTYKRTPLVIVKGKGMDLTDIHGKKYLDFFPGWGVNNVGHCNVKVMSAVRDQIDKLIHIPNNLYHPHQAKLAREIIRASFPGKVFFCNSGAEAAEAAIKFARAFGKGERFEIITMLNSFHGRTMGALTATAQKKYQEPFKPLLDGFRYVPFNDIDAVNAAINEHTVAVMLEPVQGEGGVNVADPQYVLKLRRLCDDKKILLIFDEVQTGMGRTGEMFAFKHYNVTPDIMTLAKALGGGLPIGAMVVKDELAGVFKPGMHASTFAGSPLVCRASLGVFKAIYSQKLLANTKKIGAYAKKQLQSWQKELPIIKEIRGQGLMIGIELTVPGQTIVEDCLQQGLLINCTHETVLRIMPALTVTKKQMDKALSIIKNALSRAAALETSKRDLS
ncbi:MAG: aspartate aminotransferase family protein [Candidatus Omnitrophota bacterium]